MFTESYLKEVSAIDEEGIVNVTRMSKVILKNVNKYNQHIVQASKHYYPRMLNWALQLLGAQFLLLTGKMQVDTMSGDEMYDAFHRCFSMALGAHMQHASSCTIFASVICGIPPYSNRQTSHCPMDETNKVLRQDTWKWVGFRQCVIDFYGPDSDLNELLDEFHKRITRELKEKNAADKKKKEEKKKLQEQEEEIVNVSVAPVDANTVQLNRKLFALKSAVGQTVNDLIPIVGREAAASAAALIITCIDNVSTNLEVKMKAKAEAAAMEKKEKERKEKEAKKKTALEKAQKLAAQQLQAADLAGAAAAYMAPRPRRRRR